MSEIGNKGAQITADDITINPAHEARFSKLPEPQYQALKESIAVEGQHISIVVNQNGKILDGHNRLRACRELGLEPKFEVKHFKDELEERQYMNTLNLIRRHLSPFQRVERALQRGEIEAQLAKKRQLRHLRQGDKEPNAPPASPASIISSPSVENYNNGKEAGGRVNERLAHLAGVSPSTFAHAKYIIEHGPEEMKQELREVRLQIDPAYRKLKSDQDLANADLEVAEGDGEEDVRDDETKGPLAAADA